MEKKLNNIFIIMCSLAVLLLFGACAEDEGLQPNSCREIVCTAAMPSDDAPSPQPGTLRSVTVSSNDNVLNLVAKWKEGDQIQIFVRQGGKVYGVEQPSTIYDISTNSKSCSFKFTLPEAIDSEKSYTVIGVTGIEAQVSGNDVVVAGQMKRIALDSSREVSSPMWFCTSLTNSSTEIEAQFKHLGAYEILHVQNRSDASITFKHCGYNVATRWWHYLANVVLNSTAGVKSSQQGDAESETLCIAGGSTGLILSWYMARGYSINNAKLLASVNGKSVTTTDSKTSSTSVVLGKAYHIYVTWDGAELSFGDGFYGFYSCPDSNHPHMINMGLPSGTKWACCNIGSTTPEGYGNYYAWGETAPKSVYGWSTYKWCNGSYNTLTKYCTDDNKTELDPADDAAYVNWGSGWRMPSIEQIQELINNCTTEWTTRNGVNGCLLTSKRNSASLFLPAAGCRWGGELDGTGSWGNYWSRTLSANGPELAYYLYFYSGGVDWVGWVYNRYNGQGVRAVRVSQN